MSQSEYKYKTIVYIGRFQPFHIGHKDVLDHCFTVAKNVIVVIGSCGEACTTRNPFTKITRQDFIKSCYQDSPENLKRLHFVYAENFIYDDSKWEKNIKKLIKTHYGDTGYTALVYSRKPGDSSTVYLNMFEEWEKENYTSNYYHINATDIRNIYFDESKSVELLKGMVPEPVYASLIRYRATDDFRERVKDFRKEQEIKNLTKDFPYHYAAVAGDMLLWDSAKNQVLLVQRKGYPGNGMLAIPGGFIDENDTEITDCAKRELFEETGIKYSDIDVINVGYCVLSHKDRSTRGRIVSVVYVVEMENSENLKINSCNNETFSVLWLDVNSIAKNEMFDDHYEVIRQLKERQS